MPIHVSDKQLDQMEKGRAAAVIVRSRGRKNGYALIPEHVYAQIQPLLQFVAIEMEAPPGEVAKSDLPAWTPEKNARRVALINKKHDKGLTPAEKKELRQLMAEADAYRDAVAPVQTQILELILAGLQKHSPKTSKR